jgi:hypothetical protein
VPAGRKGHDGESRQTSEEQHRKRPKLAVAMGLVTRSDSR